MALMRSPAACTWASVNFDSDSDMFVDLGVALSGIDAGVLQSCMCVQEKASMRERERESRKERMALPYFLDWRRIQAAHIHSNRHNRAHLSPQKQRMLDEGFTVLNS